jgi:NhaA family Na+:H+ antiporter
LGLLTLLGRRIPLALKVFFTAMAIADDLGAVLVIAMFYTSEIHWVALGIGALILAFLVVLNRVGVRHPLPYGLFGIALWLAFLESGIHPTIAGVLLALTIPARTQPRREAFLAQCIAVLGDFRAVGPDGEDLPMSDRQQAGAITLESIAERMQTPAQRLERTLTPWATYLILPLFALGNAGVDLSGDLGAALTSPISLGIIFGLVLGKAIGLSLFTWLAVRLGIAEMPARVSWLQLFSSTWLAGIGFTMSLFITNSAFSDPAQINAAKIGILAASLLAGILGFVFLSLTSRMRDRVSPMQPEMAAG